MRLRSPRTVLAAFAKALLPLLVAIGALVWEALGRLMSPDRHAWVPCVSEWS